MPRKLTATGDARAIALDLLLRVERTDAFADVLLAHRLADSGLGATDVALVTRLVYGTLAWQGRLDHHVTSLSRRPVRALEPAVRAVLRLGLYQLLFLERIPAYAVVDASVRLANAAAGRGAAGLVNAVLRKAAAAGRDGLPLPEGDTDRRLAAEWSHPRWLVERWRAEFGVDELPRMLEADNSPGPITIRANPLRTTRDALAAELTAAGVAVTPTRWAPHGLTVPRGAARLRRLPAHAEGRFAFQGEASQLVARLVEPRPGFRVLDACAAPGGKSTYLAASVAGGGRVIALDPAPAGIGRLSGEASRLGATAVVGVVGDARQSPLRAQFDAVLVDAPCTGLGTLRRHPELRWRRRPADVPRLAAMQRSILAGVAQLVRPGGVLVYAVCTLTREENEGMIADFLASEAGFDVEPAAAHLPPEAAELITNEGYLRTLPHRHGLDGFFAARLRRRA